MSWSAATGSASPSTKRDSNDACAGDADDVIFTWEFAADPAAAATTLSLYGDLERVEKLGEHSIKVVFKQPTPFWAEPFCGGGGLIIPRHVFAGCRSLLRGPADVFRVHGQAGPAGGRDHPMGLNSNNGAPTRIWTFFNGLRMF